MGLSATAVAVRREEGSMTSVVFRPRREVNRVLKRGRPSDVKVGILLPLPYRAASSSLAMHLFYEYINSLDNAIAYRFVYDLGEDAVESLDHSVSPKNLDLLLVSASFELDYANVARILLSLGLLPRQKGRSKPLVVIGGLAPTANPLPLADIADAVIVGEAENVLEDLVSIAGEETPHRLLENIDCAYIPRSGSRAKRCRVEELDRAYHPVAQVYSVDEEPILGHGVRVELSRGCPYLCPFCVEAHVAHPFRYRSWTRAVEVIEKGLELTPLARRVVIYSLSLFSVPYADRLLEWMESERIEASFPSLRVDHVNPSRLEAMARLGQKTLTLAPEVLVERHGCCIGKCLGFEQLLNIVEESCRLGYEHVKLYLITGLPMVSLGEEVEALDRLLRLSKAVRRYGFLEISLNILIPKPWTPFQYLPPSYVLSVGENVKEYRRLLKRYPTVSADLMDPKWGFMQAVIAQGNESLSEAIVRCGSEGCTPTLFAKLIASNRDRYRYVYEGWGRDPPWAEAVDMGFNPKYLELRFDYLAKLNK